MANFLATYPVLSTIIYIFGINSLSFLAFVWDKHCARTGKWRVQEQILLILALIGGAVGSVAGQHIARHKTRKQPFGIYLKSIIILQFVLLVTLSFPSGREFLLSILLKVVE